MLQLTNTISLIFSFLLLLSSNNIFSAIMPTQLKNQLQSLNVETIRVQTYIQPFNPENPEPDSIFYLSVKQLEQLGSPYLFSAIEEKIAYQDSFDTPIDLQYVDNGSLIELLQIVFNNWDNQLLDTQRLVHLFLAADFLVLDKIVLKKIVDHLAPPTFCELYTLFQEQNYRQLTALFEDNFEKQKFKIIGNSHHLASPLSSSRLVVMNSLGSLIAVNVFDTIYIYDYVQNRLQRNNFQLENSSSNVALALNSDGTRIVCGSVEGFINIWDIENETWQLEGRFAEGGANVRVAMNAEGNRIISGSSNNTVKIWDETSNNDWRLSVVLGQPNDPSIPAWEATAIQALSCSADGNTFVSINSIGGLQIGKFIDNEWQVRHLTFAQGAITSLAINYEGTCIALALGSEIHIWDFIENDWQLTQTFDSADDRCPPHMNAIRAIVFSRDNKHIITGSYNGKIHVWKKRDDKKWVLQHALNNKDGVYSLAINTDSTKIVCGSIMSSMTIWNIETIESYCKSSVPELFETIEK